LITAGVPPPVPICSAMPSVLNVPKMKVPWRMTMYGGYCG
jgi:hypothetical protein